MYIYIHTRLSDCTYANKHAHAHTTLYVAKYILGSVGKESSCPAGYIQVDKANCGAAARSAGVAAGANDQNTGWLEGSWGHIPVGCSINKASLTQTSPWTPLWNTISSAQTNGHYMVVCEHKTRKLMCSDVFMVYMQLCI